MGLNENFDLFYKGKRVLVTGHTGFKGTWLCGMLLELGAEVTGYALLPPSNSPLFSLSGVEKSINSVAGDIRDMEQLLNVFKKTQPEIVFHLAAQPIVKESYENPLYTYQVNVMGTVHVCECIRKTPSVKSFLNVTTDKVYKNNEWEWGYREDDVLDGFDPYSNSKSCSELVTHSYINSFYQDMEIGISTARAGNVIGGGDFAIHRIVPDCVRAMEQRERIIVRNPYSVRPYQHVLEPLHAYMMIAQKQYEDKRYAGFYNVGPDESDCVKTGELVQLFCEKWGENAVWESQKVDGVHEANFLKLDCSRIKSRFDWKPRWNIEKAMEKTVEWYKCYLEHENVSECMKKQIREFKQWS